MNKEVLQQVIDRLTPAYQKQLRFEKDLVKLLSKYEQNNQVRYYDGRNTR